MDYWEVQANTLEITSEDRKDVEEKYAVRLEKKGANEKRK